MKVNLGDIILIPLSNGWNAVAKVIFAPIGDFKNGISFVVLDFRQSNQLKLEQLIDRNALPIWYYRNEVL